MFRDTGEAALIWIKDSIVLFVLARANNHQAPLLAARPAGAVEGHEHVGDDVIGNGALPLAVALEGQVERHVEKPELNVAVAGPGGSLQDRLALLEIDVGVVDDDVLALSKQLLELLEEQPEDLLR